MRITERLVKKNYDQRQEEIKKKESRSMIFEDDVGDYLMYMEPKWQGFINDKRSVFDRKDDKSLNTAPSVFDRTAIFHTKKDEEDN